MLCPLARHMVLYLALVQPRERLKTTRKKVDWNVKNQLSQTKQTCECAKPGNIRPFEPRLEISNNVVKATTKASDQPANMRSLIRAFASRLNII